VPIGFGLIHLKHSRELGFDGCSMVRAGIRVFFFSLHFIATFTVANQLGATEEASDAVSPPGRGTEKSVCV